MLTHSSILAWRIPWVEEPGRLQSMGFPRVGRDLAIKPPPPCSLVFSEEMRQVLCLTVAFSPHGFCFLPSFLLKLQMGSNKPS